MTIVKFKFDKEKDLFNIWETCNEGKGFGHDFTKNVPKEILKLCKGKKLSECKTKIKKIFYEKHKKILIKDVESYINISWGKIEKEYFRRLKKITKEEFKFKKVNAYLTSAPRCPYRPHWRPPAFYVQIFTSIQDNLMIAGHELMHIQLN